MSDEQFRDDELVSAYLDGEATPAEIEAVEQDDALMARVEQLRSVRAAVAAPVAPMSAERQEQMISAALTAADAETAHRREARIVPIRRRRETLLAVAAAAILLAAVVSAGLIASRGGDDSDEMAAEATAAFDAGEMAEAAPAITAAPAEADMAMADDSADYEMAAEEEPMAEEALAAAMADDEGAVDADVVAELEAQLEAAEAEAAAEAAIAEAEPALEAAAEETADAPTASTDEVDLDDTEERHTVDDPARQVVDLGAFASLESLFDNIAATWSAALEDGTTADSGTCSAPVREQELELDVETAQPFIATVGAEDPLTFDGRFARRADGTAIIIYAAPPSCEIGTHNLDASDGS